MVGHCGPGNGGARSPCRGQRVGLQEGSPWGLTSTLELPDLFMISSKSCSMPKLLPPGALHPCPVLQCPGSCSLQHCAITEQDPIIPACKAHAGASLEPQHRHMGLPSPVPACGSSQALWVSPLSLFLRLGVPGAQLKFSTWAHGVSQQCCHPLCSGRKL